MLTAFGIIWDAGVVILYITNEIYLSIEHIALVNPSSNGSKTFSKCTYFIICHVQSVVLYGYTNLYAANVASFYSSVKNFVLYCAPSFYSLDDTLMFLSGLSFCNW